MGLQETVIEIGDGMADALFVKPARQCRSQRVEPDNAHRKVRHALLSYRPLDRVHGPERCPIRQIGSTAVRSKKSGSGCGRPNFIRHCNPEPD
jgi:hypothetical protein